MSTKKKLLEAAAGNAGEAVYVDDVFSTYLYDGTGSGQTITNGIDLDGEGGLVWGKPRNDASGHVFMDTERYPTPPSTGDWLSSDSTAAESTSGVGSVTSWNSDGLGITGVLDFAVHENVLWTFRKQPGFFDVVTWTGDGTTGRAISHNLDCEVGTIFVKNLNSTSNWYVYHRSLTSANYGLKLNGTDAEGFWGTGNVTNTTFSFDHQNSSGQNYVAYLFAHDAQEFGTGSDESIIKCGSYTGNGSTTGPVIDLGFEPQWILLKGVTSGASYDWRIHDTMRGWTADGTGAKLEPNTGDVEDTAECRLKCLPNGFQPSDNAAVVNASGAEYIYVAIRRPHKPAEEFAATDLFDLGTRNGTNDNPVDITGVNFPVDATLITSTNQQENRALGARLTGKNALFTDTTGTEFTRFQTPGWDLQNGVSVLGDLNKNTYSYIDYFFKRAPGFFDVVAYTGTGSNMTIPHNLGVAPELFILKKRNLTRSWGVYSKSIDIDQYLTLNTTGAAGSFALWQSTAPTATQFTVGTDGSVNGSGDTFVVYLFATVPGISKVGSYTGTASDVNVNCGFTSGARFVLVKRTDSTGDWYVWDSVRGIVAGNDPYLLLNSNAPQVTSTDYIDPLSSGFTITSTAPAALNASGGTYIFLAIA